MTVETTASSAGTRGRGEAFAGLDGIRFTAAMMVVVYHLTYVGPIRLGETGSRIAEDFSGWRAIATSLWVAVPIFFVLSGIVIAFSCEGRTARSFVARRALRLYPGALLCATITAAIVWREPAAFERFLRSATLFPAGPWISDVYWTMAVELTFYAMVTAALAIGREPAVRRLGAMLAIASFLWWSLRIGNLLAGDAWRGAIDSLDRADPYLLLDHGGFFALGIILYTLASGRGSRWWYLLAIAAAAAALANVFSSARGFVLFRGEPTARMLLAPAIWLAAVAAMAWSLRAPPAGREVRDWARTAGLATYPLYLVHAELGIGLMLLLAPLGTYEAAALALVAVLGVVCLVGFLETRVRRRVAAWQASAAPGGPARPSAGARPAGGGALLRAEQAPDLRLHQPLLGEDEERRGDHRPGSGAAA